VTTQRKQQFKTHRQSQNKLIHQQIEQYQKWQSQEKKLTQEFKQNQKINPIKHKCNRISYYTGKRKKEKIWMELIPRTYINP
jgi:hypothetical protein